MAFSRDFSLLAGALASVAIVAPAVAQDANAMFTQRYADMHKAMLTKDPAMIDKFLAPEYEMEMIGGDVINRGAMMERMNQMPAGEEVPTPKNTVISAVISGTTAQVKQQQEMTMKRQMEDGTVAEFQITIISEDTWVQRGGNWLLARSVMKDISVSKDGEVIMHQAA